MRLQVLARQQPDTHTAAIRCPWLERRPCSVPGTRTTGIAACCRRAPRPHCRRAAEKRDELAPLHCASPGAKDHFASDMEHSTNGPQGSSAPLTLGRCPRRCQGLQGDGSTSLAEPEPIY